MLTRFVVLLGLAIATPTAWGATVRIAAAQPKSRLIDWYIKDSQQVLAKIDQSLSELEVIIDKAAAEKCDVVALPEDTLGTGSWEAGNQALVKEMVPKAVKLMLTRLGAAAAKHKIYLICCNNHIES